VQQSSIEALHQNRNPAGDSAYCDISLYCGLSICHFSVTFLHVAITFNEFSRYLAGTLKAFKDTGRFWDQTFNQNMQLQIAATVVLPFVELLCFLFIASGRKDLKSENQSKI